MTTSNKSIVPSLHFGAFTHVGMRRSENQDAMGMWPENGQALFEPKGQLFIVADGMGGHADGREASRLAVRIVQEAYANDNGTEISACLKRAVQAANAEIFKRAQLSNQARSMGTTCTVMVFTPDEGFIAHVGDSRAYRVTEGAVEQLTDDHSYVGELVRKGILTEEEALHHPGRSVLNRALGVEANVEVDVIRGISLSDNDFYMLCSDGLAKVQPAEFQHMILTMTPSQAAETMVDLANKRGGEDNSTVEVIHFRRPAGYSNPKTGVTPAALNYNSEQQLPDFEIDTEWGAAVPKMSHSKRRPSLPGAKKTNKWITVLIVVIVVSALALMQYLKVFSDPEAESLTEKFQQSTIEDVDRDVQNIPDPSLPIPDTSGITPQLWHFDKSLGISDYSLNKKAISFNETGKPKLGYFSPRRSTFGFSTQVEGEASVVGKFGIIFGYANVDSVISYHLFSANYEGFYRLELISGIEETVLFEQPIDLSSINVNSSLLRIECSPAGVQFYVQDELLHQTSLNLPNQYSVGVYAGPHLAINFSDLSVSSLVAPDGN